MGLKHEKGDCSVPGFLCSVFQSIVYQCTPEEYEQDNKALTLNNKEILTSVNNDIPIDLFF